MSQPESEVGHYILSGANEVRVRVEVAEDDPDLLVWESTLMGEDFFNGPWSVTATGVSSDANQAFWDGVYVFVPVPPLVPHKLRRDVWAAVKRVLGLT